VHVPLHLAERAFALHLLLQGLERLIDVIVANEYLDDDPSSYLKPDLSKRAGLIPDGAGLVHKPSETPHGFGDR